MLKTHMMPTITPGTRRAFGCEPSRKGGKEYTMLLKASHKDDWDIALATFQRRSDGRWMIRCFTPGANLKVTTEPTLVKAQEVMELTVRNRLRSVMYATTQAE